MAKLFQDILDEAYNKGILLGKSVDATNWLAEKVSTIKEDSVNPEDILKDDKAILRRSVIFSKMYLFKYNPKHKNTLPYYDNFPLIFPLERRDDGFLGINFHYLPLTLRAKLMDALYDYGPSNIKSESRLKLGYELLNGLKKTRFFKPCIKHYLNSQLASRFVEIPATQWKIALFLPLERFSKATKQQVYKDSRRIIKGT
jgi:hypothetical protein